MTTLVDIRSRAEDDALTKQATNLYGVLSDLIRVYQFRDRDRICCHDLSVSQCHALEALVRRGPMTVNDLAAFLYLDKSTTSRVVDALQRKKMLRREPHPEDGRSLRLVATPQGEKRVEAIMQSIVQREKLLLADFEPEVRTAMIELIGRLAKTAADRVTVTGGICCCTD